MKTLQFELNTIFPDLIVKKISQITTNFCLAYYRKTKNNLIINLQLPTKILTLSIENHHYFHAFNKFDQLDHIYERVHFDI